MEHNPYDIRRCATACNTCSTGARSRKSGSLAPAVAPLVRIPPNGGEIEPVDRQAGPRHRRLRHRLAACEHGRGGAERGRGLPLPAAAHRPSITSPRVSAATRPRHAARYWGLTQQEYYARADIWPLNPEGEILVVIMCEEARAIKNLPKMLEEVPGIGVVLIGEGDLSQDLGYPRQYEHPTVAAAINEILAICKEHKVPCGHPHVDTKNVEALVAQGFRWLMPAPVRSFAALELGRKTTGR